MRTSPLLLLTALPLSLLLLAVPATAEEAITIPDAWVEASLEAAGDNRAELEEVLAHYADDPQKLVAARFLVANMLPHGYVVTELRDEKGEPVAYDPLAYDTFQESREALEALEEERGSLDFARDRLVKDVETITADFLVRHIDASFAAWKASPESTRVGFRAFLEYVLPYRGSQEPLDLWIEPLRARYATVWEESGGDVQAARKQVSKDAHQRVRFNERYYLHPTDQGFSEMVVSGQGRCEDITNMETFAARSIGIATAADYTPAWAHGDNNHAWNVLLDAAGHGFHKVGTRAAKVYRKTFALQRDNLAFLLPEGQEAPNRFLASRTYVDVTDQYGPTTDVTVALDPQVAGTEAFAYLCVFNGGRWTAIHWGRVAEGTVTFDRMGRDIVYLPAVYRDGELVPAGAPLLVHRNGTVETLTGTGGPADVLAVSVAPRKVSPDTAAETPESYLEAGTAYVLQRWTPEGWETVAETQAGAAPLRFERLASDGLYWLVVRESRRLERIFTISEGRQRFW